MTNFEKIVKTPEALGAFLASITVADGRWEEAFHRMLCDGCQAENCDAENCQDNAERDNVETKDIWHGFGAAGWT